MAETLDSLTRIAQGMVVRGVIQKVDATTKMQRVQVQGAGFDGVWMELFEPLGITAVAERGAECLVLMIGGTSHPVAILTADRRQRPTGGSGKDVTLYDGHGHALQLTSSGAALDCNLGVTGSVDASVGFEVGGSAGKNGLLTIIATIAGAPVTLAALTYKGGIMTGVVPTSPTTWVGD